MGQTVNNFPLRGNFEGILEVIGDIRDTNGEVVCVRNFCNQPECGCRQDWRLGLVKFNAFYSGSYIDTIAWSVVVDAVTDLLYGGDKTYWRTRFVLDKLAW